MGKRKKIIKQTENQPNSFFRKNEITSLRDIAIIYAYYPITQQLVNNFVLECAHFLRNKKGINGEIIENVLTIKIYSSKDQSLIELKGNNLLSSLWLIDIYPENPETLINKSVYRHGDFVYKFYTKNQNLSIKHYSYYERKLANYS